MSSGTGWNVTVLGNFMRAHFKQADGPSRPGILWAVVISDGKVETKVLVQSYDTGLAPEQDAQRVMSHMAKLIQSGWTPEDYTGAPGELIVD